MGELEGEPAAERVADEVRGLEARGVEVALEPVDEALESGRRAVGERRPAAVPEQRDGEDVVVGPQRGHDRLPDLRNAGEAVDDDQRLA